MDQGYEIIEESPNNYVFFNKDNVEYQLMVRPSGIVYQDYHGEDIDVLEVALNCDSNTASKDYKTSKTIAAFCTRMSLKHDAVFLQMHNQPEQINNNKVERRGLSRIKLWSRVISKYFKGYIMFTNLLLDPNKHSDILTIVVRKDSVYFKHIVASFYRFSHTKMYPKNTANV